MLQKFLIFVLICITKYDYSSSHSVENLYTVLDQTTEFFKNLSNVHEVLNGDVWNNINNAITKYMENTTKIILRNKRRSFQNEIQPDKDVNVLQGFEETLSLSIQNAEDIAFFSMQDGDQLHWFAATLDSSYLQIYQLIDNKVKHVYTYLQQNGKQIVVHNYNMADTLIVVETNSHDIIVLHFGKDRRGNYNLQFKQEFKIVGVTHMNMWFGMNKLYLAIASETKIYIFVWLGEHFDRIDILLFGARKLLFFQNKSFMHVVAVGFVDTKIFRFLVQANKFLEMQKLHYTEDVSWFYFKKGHFEEHFLVLTHNNFTVLYKEMYNRFVPFQKITSTKFLYSSVMGNTVVLFCMKEDMTEIYQYNGWKFVKLHTELSGIHQIREIRLGSEDILIVQNQNRDWKFLKPIWTAKKTWQSLQNEINVWCSEIKRKMFQRALEKIPDLKNPVISNGYIGHLRVQNLNGYNSNDLIHLTQRYKNVIAKLNSTDIILTQGIGSVDGSKYMILHGKKITVKCNRNCHVRYLKTDNEIGPAVNYEKSKPIDTLRFANLKIKAINKWKCPIPNLKVDDVLVNGSINGMSIQDLHEKALKISGDQEILGMHTFINLYTTNASMPLNIATSSTKQIMRMKEVRVKELHLTEDEFFLPLNGSTTVMNGSITAPRVTVTGTVHVRCGIKGKGLDRIVPIREISTPLILSKNYFLQNVTFRNLVRVKDIVNIRGLSLKELLENGIPLDSDVPVHLLLSSNNTQWNNMTLRSCMSYITKNSIENVVISGVKFMNNTITLTDAAYANVPIPKLTIPLCAMGVMTFAIRTSSITVGDLTVKNLNVSRVFGANNLNSTVFDTVSILHSIDFSKKLFAGQIFVKNISASRINGTDVRGLGIHMNKWIDVDRLKGSIDITKLVVKNLETPASFNFPLPMKVKDVIVEADSKIERINNLDIRSFMQNVMKVDDVISLEHITFMHGFTSDHMYTSYSTLNLSYLDAHPNLHSKHISTILETNAINIPQIFGYSENISSTFIIQGSANFLTEPIVQNINNVNLKQLSENLWMLNQDTIVSGININLTNINLTTDVIIDSSFVNSFDMKIWSNLSKRLLSKTKEQHIAVISSFKNVEVPAIVAANNSILRSTDSNLEDMLTNSLMRNKPQIVNAVWRFHELNINDMHWNGKLNNIDLNTDIVRYDAKQNIVTGKKKISSLMTKDLWLSNMNFSHLVSNALTKECRKLSVIKGRKTFNNITLNDLSVKGTIMGRNVETALLKSGNQVIFGIKKLQGQFNTSSLITDSVVNDVNLTELIKHQVKKHKAEQVIKSRLDFRNDIEIFGNITIGRHYEKTDLRKINNKIALDTVLSKTMKVMDIVEDVATALQNRAVYVNKFEIVDGNMLKIIPDVSITENIMHINSSTCLYESLNVSTLCKDIKVSNISANGNSSVFIIEELVLLDDIAFVVTVSSDFVSIYSYAIAEERLYKTELYVPGVLQASVEPIDNSLWIVLRLPEQTLILNYQTWGEYEQYILPGSDEFVISKTPNNQHLLIRSDGIWNLGGIGYPEHIFKMPLKGQIRTFSHGVDYYIQATTKNGTVVLKVQYMSN